MIYDDIPPDYILLGSMTRIENEWRYYDNELKIPFPWYTRPCLEWLLTIDLKFTRVFEYGVGDSTKWYIKKGVIRTYGVDDNIHWAKSANAYHAEKFYEYVTSIERNAPYDIVVIDGIYRDACTKYALEFLKADGYLIIDNYKQPSVQAEWPLTEKLIEGMEIMEFKEPGHEDWQTIVVRKP
jgi:hypothetical protein